MGDILISGLIAGDCMDRLCVRASRTWDFYDPQNETKLLHSNLVLIDEKGNAVHAQIYPPVNEKFKTLIKEGNVYNLSFFVVKNSANRKYKAVQNDIMINFTRWTTVEEVLEVPPSFPMLTYSLTPMHELPSRANSKEHYTDVIGAVTTISNVLPLRTREQVDTFKRIITIRNESNASLDVVLWGERATSFPAEEIHKNGQNSPQIIIFVGTLIRTYAGNISLSGGTSCKWYINPNVPETKNLTTSLEGMHQPIILANQPVYNKPKPSAEHKKVSDIKNLNPFQYKKTEWLVTVKIMKIDNSWWYESCNSCFKSTRPYGNTYKCSNPSCASFGSPNTRYKLVFMAGDETGAAEFIMFGRVAQNLIKKTVDTLRASNPPGFIPDEITSLLERTFTFNVSFTENTKSSGNVSFQVNALIAEIKDGDSVPITPIGSQTSSGILSQGASGSMQDIPEKSSTFPDPPTSIESETNQASSTTPSKSNVHEQPATTPQSSMSSSGIKAAEQIDATSQSARSPTAEKSNEIIVGTKQSATKKRAHASPSKKAVKKLLLDDVAKDDIVDD